VSHGQAKEIAASAIPVIDMAPLYNAGVDGVRRVAREMRGAAHSIGFFYVRNHGIPQELLDRTDAVARRFFRLPLEEKLKVEVAPWHRGFIRIGEAKMYDAAQADLKESFIFGAEAGPEGAAWGREHRMRGPNRWPDALPELKTTLNEFFDAGNRCGKVLFRGFAASLGLDLDHFTREFDRPVTRGAVVFYPPQPREAGPDRFGVAPHTDYGCLTLLYQDPVGGLEVQDRHGDWVVARPIEGTLVINVGDLLARWTNNLFRSTPHRVVNRSGRERLSIAAFVDPNYETMVAPVCADGAAPLFPPVACGDYIVSRYDASFAYRHRDGKS
jgi:isopenicillin N synthase-like dioxygenase